METRPTLIVPLVAGLVAGFVAGALVSLALRPPARDGTSADSGADAALISELRHFREDVARLGEQFASARGVTAGTSAPNGAERKPAEAVAPGRSIADERVVAAMERLAAALEARAPAIGSRAPQSPSGASAVKRPDDEIRTLAAAAAKEGYASVKSYRFWTYQQVLDHFGAPDATYPQDGYLWWVYTVTDDAGKPTTLRMQFFDGFVAAFYGVN